MAKTAGWCLILVLMLGGCAAPRGTTASMDPETAARVNEAIDKAMEGRTCIVIVHRALMARDADRIVVMDKGRVVESGNHEELIANPESLYRAIYERQYGPQPMPPQERETDE